MAVPVSAFDRRRRATPSRTGTIPPHAYFLVSAVVCYLGPAFAVLLFARVDALGVARLHVASAAAVFAVRRRPWRVVAGRSWAQRRVLVALGGVLGAMNVGFYVAIDRLPLGTVGAIEFLGPILLAAIGLLVLRQHPHPAEIVGIAKIVSGVAVHQEGSGRRREHAGIEAGAAAD